MYVWEKWTSNHPQVHNTCMLTSAILTMTKPVTGKTLLDHTQKFNPLWIYLWYNTTYKATNTSKVFVSELPIPGFLVMQANCQLQIWSLGYFKDTWRFVDYLCGFQKQPNALRNNQGVWIKSPLICKSIWRGWKYGGYKNFSLW